jgi:hypothetical protein
MVIPIHFLGISRSFLTCAALLFFSSTMVICILHLRRIRGFLAFTTTSRFISSRILSLLRSSPDDYEGDLYVPQIALNEANTFGSDRETAAALSALEADLEQKVGASPGNQELAFALMDPQITEFPLIHVSSGFEALTGYPRHTALGRNCRFLLPKNARVNSRFNETECDRLTEFCHSCKESHRSPNKLNTDSGRRLAVLLVNENRGRGPLLALMFLEQLQLRGRKCIMALITDVTHAAAELPELLAGDPVALSQLDQLRTIIRKHDKRFGTQDHWGDLHDSLQEWRSQLPQSLQLPRLPSSADRSTSSKRNSNKSLVHATPEQRPFFPVVGLQVDESTSLDTLMAAMKTGVRHFHLTFQDYDDIKDQKRNEMEGRLLALKLSQKIATLRNCNFHYLRAALVFTMRTPPQLVPAFQEVQKAMKSAGYEVAHWLLDVRNSEPAETAKHWEIMQQTKLAGDVKGIGLYGRLPTSLLAALEKCGVQLSHPHVPKRPKKDQTPTH